MLLELKNIRKFFPIKRNLLGQAQNYVKAVNGVDLKIFEKENLGIVGESGCGKTTLARIILKLILMDSGRIIYDGHDMKNSSSAEMRRFRQDVQMVFQDPFSSLDPRFTVKNIIGEAMLFDKKRNEKEKEIRIKELLQDVHLPSDILNRFPHEFSGGERQRIAIARALATYPKLLILDEAVSSLDVIVQAKIIQLFLDLQKKFNLTYVFISHNLRVIRKMASHIAVMYQGKIVEAAKTESLFYHPRHPYTQRLLSAATKYKVTSSDDNIMISENAGLIDKGGGHYVLDD